MTKPPSLDGAYDLKTPQDSIDLYAEWANTYDTDFADDHGYVLHAHVARAYVNAGGYQPVLDMGAGTGLCGQALRDRGLDALDATDISADMLKVAETKGLYQTLFVGDIIAGLDVADGAYAGAVSSGTFTHGHVGPEALDELLRVVRSGGVICISINTEHFAAHGFEAKLAALDPMCREISKVEVPIYEGGSGDHSNDTAFVTLIRKA
ncbi:Ubiquinone/menaquinone biosynthesis C-methyltransferase UbiE [Ascidiaceihabitans donghaensis]|uniref:Ubiquinone/menaquinone biosynthesis C-methyltransferase UbiE n=1 Tax=Ascidiaceihabitans donghaensis TaxID=1510460 RepID=A0A2R8B8Y5_9RHOB|nr:methyltransferase domain-containing protein [Ascidiaceihabitans donghaensis]SPH19540.1 Ubiquinone/menaquinone biosynthesis C-methyltransferase UbiE [Ascidiaceihabitans donghaensis]